MNRGRPPFPVSVPPPREAKDSALDDLIEPMSFADTRDYEKGPVFSPRGVRILVGSAMAIVLTALAIALA